MTPCLCGENNCRGTITGFNRLPFDVQRAAIRPDAEFPGLVLAHILMDMPALVNILQQASPLTYLQYLDVLHRQVTLSMQFFKAAHPGLLLSGAGLYLTGSIPARKAQPSSVDGELLTGYSSDSNIGLGQPY
jgi:hypothetical protein